MSIASSLEKKIKKELLQYTGEEPEIKEMNPVPGGDIHATYQLSTEKSSYFLKTSPHPPENLFKTEYKGLLLLQQQNVISVPSPISYGQVAEHGFIIMEFIPKSPADSNFWKNFAKGMANLHLCTADYFGLKEDNFIGPLPQANQQKDNWSDFFISQRLQPFIKRCIDQHLLSTDFIDKSMKLYSRIPHIFPAEQPALLHGDLWGGNYRCGPSAQPYIFDPAIYYGHREIDLAMTRLFGGFDRQFYWQYNEHYPLADDWQKRIRLCQLYPLLVHSLLFGGGYVQQVRNIIEEYG